MIITKKKNIMGKNSIIIKLMISNVILKLSISSFNFFGYWLNKFFSRLCLEVIKSIFF